MRGWAADLGFQQLGIAATDLQAAEAQLEAWLAAGYHGAMDYMQRHGRRRTRPADLLPGTRRVIVVRMDYLPDEAQPPAALLAQPEQAYVARYTLGRDYHKLMRHRLQRLAQQVEAEVGQFNYRVFVDSGPVMEKPLAAKAGLGWQGKHTNLINKEAGSWFLLGVIYTDLPLPVDGPVTDHCGSCRACLDVCPTGAIVAPYQLDARRCISYLTIELRGSIPVELRTAIGNRIFGCDDCQLFCPWNKFARPTAEADFQPRHQLDSATLLELFNWNEATWEQRSRGSAIRRAGYTGWLRNIAVALGNAPASAEIVAALQARADHPSALVREHVQWALDRQTR
ncbi:MAG: tRNA epoxyqueuosine(34) reductase QueG [Gammaproteobacteria bacterium]|nr:tRNA epoxyqueuosine(34) reductase QueG [Gammaproteobacteria bacterium]